MKKWMKALDSKVVSTSAAKKGLETISRIPRTCHEALLNNPWLTSGVYWIDPDGQGVGIDPIQVTCDMSPGILIFWTTPMNITADTNASSLIDCSVGVTLIGHDSESAMNVGQCFNSGCYKRLITYNASSKQILPCS